jgi:2-polyprenyl-6-methoxyphenol hydroxylase-like FAD-dependent oxidoreductase
MNQEEVDIIICGCGPTGAMLAGYLGSMNINCIILEKENSIVTDPRGIALDEDGIRLLQGLGLYQYIFSEIGACMEKFKFVTGTQHDLHKDPFLEFNLGISGPTGHVGVISHKQPVLEKYLRSKFSRDPSVEFRPGSMVVSIFEDADHVYVDYKASTGEIRRIKANFLAAADGKTGFTRKNYLEPKGIILESTTSKYNETWVALNWKITLPTPETHPEFPLWKLGYFPEDVYNQFFPEHFRFLCNPNRPAVCGRFGKLEDRLWRFEFVVTQGENGDDMSRKENILKIVYPYITHKGSKYGLPNDVAFPEDCITVIRCRPFTFAARSCNKWALGRVILCGDAAHVFPPFGGQGIASGFRDASALAWRLAIACRPNFDPYEDLLESWYLERKQQLDVSLNSTVENGYFVTERNAFKIFVRDWAFWAVQKIPHIRRWLQMGQRRYGSLKYVYQPGLAFLPKGAGGTFLPQVYCKRLDAKAPIKHILFTDDVVFESSKKSLFQIVVLLDHLEELEEVQKCLKCVDQHSNNELCASETTYLVHNPEEKGNNLNPYVCRIATAEEFAQSRLCYGRPTPLYYNAQRIKEAVNSHKYIIVRPDRLIYMSCMDKAGLFEAAASLATFLAGAC